MVVNRLRRDRVKRFLSKGGEQLRNVVARLETNSNYMQLDLILLSCATVAGLPALNRLMIDYTTLAHDWRDAGHSASTITS